MSFFQKQRTGRQNRSCLGGWYQWEGEEIRKGCSRVNMVDILCTPACKWKSETCRNSSRNGGRRLKENDGGGEFNYDIL
jgi:hypothetical protein